MTNSFKVSAGGKGKDKKDGSRQATLFGMMPGLTNDKPSRKKKRDTDTPPASEVTTTVETQASDITMTDDSQTSTVLDSQSQDFQDTSGGTIPLSTTDETDPKEYSERASGNIALEDNPEPIEWPPSPTPLDDVPSMVEVSKLEFCF